MKITLLLSHPDEVSGTFVFDDGVKIHFGEGLCANMTIVHPDGRRANHICGWNPVTSDWYGRYVYLADRYGDDDSPTADSREMTKAEIQEWEKNC